MHLSRIFSETKIPLSICVRCHLGLGRAAATGAPDVHGGHDEGSGEDEPRFKDGRVSMVYVKPRGRHAQGKKRMTIISCQRVGFAQQGRKLTTRKQRMRLPPLRRCRRGRSRHGRRGRLRAR